MTRSGRWHFAGVAIGVLLFGVACANPGGFEFAPGGARQKGAGGWRKVHSGTSETLYGVGGSSRTDAWAVGSRGTILHWDGKTWQNQVSPAGDAVLLWAVWSNDATDAWAVGQAPEARPVVLHWNGHEWGEEKLPTFASPCYVESLTSVWASGRSDVWVVGKRGVLRWDGTAWTCVLHLDSNNGYVSGTSPRDVWVAANGGTVSHWDGARWSTANTAIGADGVFARRPTDVWVVNALYPGAEIHHFDGAAWTKTSVDYFVLGSAWGAADGPVWTGGAEALTCGDCGGLVYWNGSGWFRWDTRLRSEIILGIWGSARDDVWAVGGDGAILHFGGATNPAKGTGTSAR